MKSTIFREVLNVEYIEVNKSVSKTIQYLCEQSEACHTLTPNGMKIFFECSKQGKINVKSSFGVHRDLRDLLQIYYVYGSVISKDNKTYVKITSIYKKYHIWLRGLLLILLVLIIPTLLILKEYLGGTLFIPALLAFFIGFFIAIIDFIKTTSMRKMNGLELVASMENEIKKRVRNIERWDE